MAKLKPRHVLIGAGAALVLWNFLKDKAGGDCGCGPKVDPARGSMGVRGATDSGGRRG